MRGHRDLDVWQEAIAFVSEVYRVTRDFPPEETFGLKGQMRRAAVSIPSNIAEGAARQSPKDFQRFLKVALGSAAELETQILIAKNLDYVRDENTLLEPLSRIRRMISGLLKSLDR